MSYSALVIGESGSGKSTSLRNMQPEKVLLIQAYRKALPFEDNSEWREITATEKGGNVIVTDKASDITQLMLGTKKKVIVLDDFQYVMANEFMRRSEERGYDKFTEIGRNAWNILTMASSLPPDVRVYILSHSDTSESGRVKIKTIGRMLDEKITVEGMFTTVMRTVVRDGKHYFSTRNSGFDTVKTPMGMFKDELIENDLAAVDRRICEYYRIGATSAPQNTRNQ